MIVGRTTPSSRRSVRPLAQCEAVDYVSRHRRSKSRVNTSPTHPPQRWASGVGGPPRLDNGPTTSPDGLLIPLSIHYLIIRLSNAQLTTSV